MSKHPFKTVGIPRAGLEYQDLIGIEVLLRLYRDPELFNWVEIESEDPEVRSLDDIVALRKDDTYELYQVKFTSDPDKHFLNWGWLLCKKGKGSSFLQKWASRLESLENIHTAKLRTNRKPDAEFATSLKGNLVDFDCIKNKQKAKLAAELGGEKAARSFFERFEFAHSEVMIDDLEFRLKDDIVPTDTDQRGWLMLRDQVCRWATRKNSPEPDGKIRHRHLVQIINKSLPKPIPQDFTIPELYQIPSDKFHKDFEHRIKTAPHQISILWGSPGRGKSTYLSFLVDSLRESDLPVVRHHYFLSLKDSTADRVSFPEISSSIMDQIKTHYPDAVHDINEDNPDQLREWLEACGKYYKEDGKRFFLVIDGLDHVWRERPNISQMEHLFNYLLPCPENVFLMIGTQKVATEQLPLKLTREAENKDWIEIPPMDEEAVHKWIAGQHSAGRLSLHERSHIDNNIELSEVGSAFFRSCNGNPLHLIYSFEALVRLGGVATPEKVLSLPSCPEGDIKKYYAGLWSRLSTESRKVLHLIAATNFQWPPDGLQKCAGSLHEVDHLLEHQRTGLIPFHGSILAFAREQNDHQDTFQSVLPSLIKWLEDDAPEYWCWAWLWIMRAKSGDVNPLLTGTTRDWVIQSLAEGWPINQIINILRIAENHAFEQNNYERTWQLRSLKIRLQNGQEFQTSRFHDFRECALRISKHKEQITSMADTLSLLAYEEVVTLLRCLDSDNMEGIGEECYEEIRKRFNLQYRLNIDFHSLYGYLIEAIVEFGEPDLHKLLDFINQFDDRDNVFQIFLMHVVRTKKFDMACEMLALLVEDKYVSWRNATENSIVRIACVEGIDLMHRLTPTKNISPLLSCWYRLKGHTPPEPCSITNLSSDVAKDQYQYGPNPIIEEFFHDFFFLSLDAVLHTGNKCMPVISRIDQSKMGWLQEATDHLWNIALDIGCNSSDLNYASIFLGLANLEPVDRQHRPSEPASAQYRALRATIGTIALDLHALRCAMTGPSLVDSDTFEAARKSRHWQDEIWIDRELKGRRISIDPDAVRQLVNDVGETESKSVTTFNDRVDCWIELAQLSSLYGLAGSSCYLTRAADCIIGYGWRKDTFIFEILSAVEKVHLAGVGNVQPWLKALAPIIDQITDFTDGKETNYAPVEFINLVAKVKPEWLPKLYTYFIANEKYSFAEETLRAVLENLNFSDDATSALMSSLLESEDLHILEKLHKAGKIDASKHWQDQKKFLGISSSKQKLKKEMKESDTHDNTDDIGLRGKPPDVTKFGPDKLTDLLQEFSGNNLGYKHRENCLIHWLQHWADNNEGLIVLKTIDDYFETHDSSYEIEHLLDGVFEISLKCEGKKKAYEWLVKAHVQRCGWNKYSSDENFVNKCLDFAANHYKTKWKDYIQDTSKPARYWKEAGYRFVIGESRLVDFLLRVGQTNLAISLVNTMVQVLIEEVQDQPIPPAKWLS